MLEAQNRTHNASRNLFAQIETPSLIGRIASSHLKSDRRAVQFSTLVLPHPRQLEVRQLFNLTEKSGRLDGQRTAYVEDTSKGWIGLAQLDKAYERPLVARFCGKRFLTHLLPQPMLSQQLTECCGRIKFRIGIASRCHTSMWHRKYITRRL